MLPSADNDGMSGKVWLDEDFPVNNSTFIRSPIAYLCRDLQNNQVISVRFKDPEFEKSFIFTANVLEGAKMPEPTLKPSDWNNNQRYRPNTGFNNDDNYRNNRNPAVANRMLQHSLNIEGGSSDQTGCISSAYGGHNSSYYGSYRTSNNNNNNNNYNNSYNNNNNNNRRNYDNNYQPNRYQQPQNYGNNNNYQQQRPPQQYNNNYRPYNQFNNNFNNNNNNDNNNQRNYQPNNNPVSI